MDISQLYALEMMRKRRLADTFPAYRTDDLVLMLDGIKNQRSGGHNSSATVWEDLAGNMDVTLYNATWGADHAAFTGEDNSYGIGDYWTFTKGTTIEAVFSSTTNGISQTIAGWMHDDASFRFGCWVNSLRFLGSISSPVALKNFNPPLPNEAFGYCAFSKNISMYNGGLQTDSTSWLTGSCSRTKFRLSAWVQSPSTEGSPIFRTLLGNIYAVRVYDANLTAEELYEHWLIDKKRFNIPEE